MGEAHFGEGLKPQLAGEDTVPPPPCTSWGLSVARERAQVEGQVLHAPSVFLGRESCPEFSQSDISRQSRSANRREGGDV